MKMERCLLGLRKANSVLSNNYGRSCQYHTIQAIPRDYTGNRISERDRAQGRIPTVVLDATATQPDSASTSNIKHLLTTERKQIKSIVDSVQLPFFYSTTFQLHIRAGAGSSNLLHSGTVLPVKLHRDPQTGRILNLVLSWAQNGSNMDVRVPLVFKGQDTSPGITKGGHLKKITSLKLRGPIEHIPSKIEVDVSKLDIGDRLFPRHIGFHSSLKLLTKNWKLPICRVMSTKLKILESEDIPLKLEESEPLLD